MRVGGRLTEVALAPGDHACWTFEDDDELVAAAVAQLADGLERNEQLLYVADRRTDAELLDDLAPLGDVERLVAEGRLDVRPAHTLYARGERLVPEVQVAGYRALTEAALATGRSGFRVFADATVLADDPAARRAFLAYELAVDRYMAVAPMTAVCAYDRRVLGDDGCADMACMHPLRRTSDPTEPGFHLCAAGDGLLLAGEVDLSNRTRFATALEIALACSDPVIDAAGLTFIDAAGLGALARAAEAHGRRITLAEAPPVAARAIALLGGNVDVRPRAQR